MELASSDAMVAWFALPVLHGFSFLFFTGRGGSFLSQKEKEKNGGAKKMGGQWPPKITPVVLFRKRCKAGGIQLFKPGKETHKRRSNLFRTARAVAFNIERHQWIVQRKAQQKPTVSMGRVKAYAHAFVVGGGKAPLLLSRIPMLRPKSAEITLLP